MKVFNIKYEDKEDLLKIKERISPKDKILIQVFCGKVDENFIKEILKVLKEYFPFAKIIGTTTSGEIVGNKILENSVVLSFCCFENVYLKSAIVEGENPWLIGETLSSKIIQDDTKVAITFLDGLNNSGDTFVKAFKKGNYIIAGGMAGDNSEFKKTYVFNEEKVISKGAVGVSLNSNTLLAKNIYVFNWIAVGREFVITKAKGNVLYKIDNKAALDVYLHYYGTELEELLPMAAMEIPIVVQRGENEVARACMGIDKKSRSLILTGEVKEGEKFRFGIGDASLIFNSIQETFRQMKDEFFEAVFAYSCTARKMFMGECIKEEIEPLSYLAPLSGFFTYGEFFHFGNGKNELLNQTLTILGLSERRNNGFKNIQNMRFYKNNLKRFIVLKALTNFINVMAKELEQKNILLQFLSETDFLCKIFNRRKILHILGDEIEKAKKLDYSLSVILVEIGYLKKINEEFGYNTGDEVLKKFTRAVQKKIREDDFFGRWEGGRFIIISRKISNVLVIKMIEEIKTAVKKEKFGINRKIVLNFGTALLRKNESISDFLKRAEISLAKKKNIKKES